MKRYLLIVNPLARDGDRLAAEAAAVCSHNGLDHTVLISGRAGEIEEITRHEAAQGGELRIFVFGGDGSLNEAVRGAVGYDNTALSHIPCGTGNDFVRSLGGRDAFLDIGRLINGREMLIDLIEVTIDNKPSIHAVNICSVGVDADVAAGMARVKWARRWGSKMPYNLSLVMNIFKGVRRPYTVTLDGERLDGRYTIMTCCNGQVYGGGFKACPDADPADGRLEFLLVKGLSRLELIRIVGRYADGKYKELAEYIRHTPGRSIVIEGIKPFYVNYDGETVLAKSAAFAISGHKLRFLIPEPGVPVKMPG